MVKTNEKSGRQDAGDYPFTILPGPTQRRWIGYATGIPFALSIPAAVILLAGFLPAIVFYPAFALAFFPSDFPLASVVHQGVDAILLFSDTVRNSEYFSYSYYYVAILGFIVMIIPKAWRRYALGQLRKDAFSILESDERAPVLFLRSFEDDDLPDLTSIMKKDHSSRHEEELVKIFRRIGPVIAIGRPGERVPEFGAARFYVPYEEWQTAVIHFLEEASLVVVLVGRTEGVAWEVKSVVERVDLARIMFFFPYIVPKEQREKENSYLSQLMRSFQDRGNTVVTMWGTKFGGRTLGKTVEGARRERVERYNVFYQMVNDRLRHPLPQALGDGCAIVFSADGVPRIINPKRPFFTLRRFGPFYMDHKRTFKAFIEERASDI